jgi:hypothetical protein
MTTSLDTAETLVNELTALLDLGREILGKIDRDSLRDHSSGAAGGIRETGRSQESWTDSIVAEMAYANAEWSNGSIYRAVRRRRRRSGFTTPPEFEATVRQTLQACCSSCKRYRGGPDLFEHPRRGYWRLKSS